MSVTARGRRRIRYGFSSGTPPSRNGSAPVPAFLKDALDSLSSADAKKARSQSRRLKDAQPRNYSIRIHPLVDFAKGLPDKRRQACPHCSKPMVVKKNRKDGSFFWACRRYPTCSATHSLNQRKFAAWREQQARATPA